MNSCRHNRHPARKTELRLNLQIITITSLMPVASGDVNQHYNNKHIIWRQGEKSLLSWPHGQRSEEFSSSQTQDKSIDKQNDSYLAEQLTSYSCISHRLGLVSVVISVIQKKNRQTASELSGGGTLFFLCVARPIAPRSER